MEHPTSVGLYLGCYHRIMGIVPPPLPDPYRDENLTELIGPEAFAPDSGDTFPAVEGSGDTVPAVLGAKASGWFG